MADGTTVSTVASDQAADANTLAIIGTDRRLDVAVDQASGVVDRIRAHRTGGAYLGTFVTQWSDLAHAIRTGEAPQPSLASGRPLLQVLLAAAQSASTGSPVRRVDAPARLVQ
jgi:predicted dehydrogenase